MQNRRLFLKKMLEQRRQRACRKEQSAEGSQQKEGPESGTGEKTDGKDGAAEQHEEKKICHPAAIPRQTGEKTAQQSVGGTTGKSKHKSGQQLRELRFYGDVHLPSQPNRPERSLTFS